MDQSEGHGKKLRHSKEDNKRYRKRRKLKKKGVEGALPYKMRESSTGLMHFNSNLPVAVKQYKVNDLYEVKKEAEIILELQQQYHPNLPYVLGICVREKPYLMITVLWKGV